MSLCLEKDNFLNNSSELFTKQEIINLSKENSQNSQNDPDNQSLKRQVDELCDTNKQCQTGICLPPKNCELIFASPMCGNIKVCQTSNTISKTSNFISKNI